MFVMLNVNQMKQIKQKISPNNITNKLRRGTIIFDEVQDSLCGLGYNIEFIEDKN